MPGVADNPMQTSDFFASSTDAMNDRLYVRMLCTSSTTNVPQSWRYTVSLITSPCWEVEFTAKGASHLIFV